MNRKIKLILTLILTTVCLFSGCSDTNDTNNADNTPVTREFFAMDTIIKLTAYGENAAAAVDEAVAEIQRLDILLSVGNPESQVYEINHGGSPVLSDDLKILLGRADWIYKNTGGAYDITVYPLMQLWGFTEDSQSVPSPREIEDVLGDCGADRLVLTDDHLDLGGCRGIDFGGIAKGYAGDQIMNIYMKHGITSGVISLGGNVQCYGSKPDGSPWRCGITDPHHPQDSTKLLGVVNVSGKAVVTSGDYERFFEENGKRYHHIMDPETGYPAESGLRSVTIISSDGTLADGLSTACFVMGKEGAMNFWKSNSSLFDMILLTDSGELIVTDGIKDKFETPSSH